jgi:methionyl-tRNA synthetase
MPKQKFYLTTPIYYVNARPHIGHAYTTLVADVIARRHRLLGDDTFFLTGTDEHGQKIERSAAAAGIPPQQFTDQVSIEFRNLWDRMGLTYDDYIRTTESRHKQGAQRLFADLHQRGQIYLSTYTGQYSIGEEIFVEGPPGVLGPDGKPTETVTEENFFFRLSEYQLPLLDLIESDTLLIQPESRKNEVLSFLRGDIRAARLSEAAQPDSAQPDKAGTTTEPGAPYIASDVWASDEVRPPQPSPIAYSKLGNPYVPGNLRDLSVSRSSFTWGIPVPEPAASETQQKHVIYVWLDALANYMTAIGYGSDEPEKIEQFKKYWPADVHIMAKEITRQHCIYWPAFLLALNPRLQHHPDKPTPTLSFEEHREWAKKWLPKSVTAHGWLLFDDSKMSKSKGNIVRTETILDAFGTEVYAKQFPDSTKHEQDLFAADVLRYHLLREIPFGQDGSFSFEAMITRYNADLANGYGNLVSRTLNLITQNQDGVIVEAKEPWILRSNIALVENDELRRAAQQITETKSVIQVLLDMKEVEDHHKNSRFDLLTLLISARIKIVDIYLNSYEPWKLAKSNDPSDRKKMVEVLYTAVEGIRIITALLYPVLPNATAKVWLQLGLGDIEAAAKSGDLKDLKWGGLKPGTKLGPLSPIFPRADKGLAQIMTDIEANAQPTPSKFVDEKTTHTSPVPTDPTHPGAPPRTAAIDTPNPGATVGGSHAILTERPANVSHTEAPASGPFAASAAASSTPDTPQIAIDDFVKIDLRVAQIVIAERIPKADKLLRLEVDLGYEKRQILSGIAEWYTPEELIGKKIVVIANLAPRRMRGLESHGMLLAASNGENGKPILATFGEDIALGSRLR